MINMVVKSRCRQVCERVLVVLALLGFSVSAVAQSDYIKVMVEVPGTLMEKVMELDGSRINSLAVEGALNSADLEFLGNGTGKILTVRNLDMSNVTVAADEGQYKAYTLSDYSGEVLGNKIMRFYLSDNPRIETETKDIGAIGGMNIIVSVYGNNLAGLFAGNTTLEKVVMPSFIKEIGTATFYECTSINGVDIPEQVTKIADRAFYHAENLSSVVLPEELTSIGESAFNKTALTSVILPQSVESVGDYAFFNVASLRQVNLSGVSYIGADCFGMCSIEGCVDLSGAIDIGYGAFSGNEINELKFSGRLRSIGAGAFSKLFSLTGVDLPEGLEYIGGNAFERCENLASVTIPSTLIDIGYRAFWGTPWEDNLKGENGVLYIGNIAYKYDYASVIDEKVLTFKEGTRVIGSSFDLDEYTVNGYARYIINEINFPSTLKRINGSSDNISFGVKSNCEIQLPDGLEYIGDRAFQNSAISLDAIPESVTYIGNYAFNKCENILEMNLGFSSDSIYIGYFAFEGCKNISEVNLGPSIRYLGCSSFGGCSALSEISYDCNPDSVGGNVFWGTSPYRVKISPEVVVLKEGLFNGCHMTKLIFESVENRKELLSIEPGCFSSSNLVSVTLPPMDYFSGFRCDNLKEIIVEGDCNIIDNPVGTHSPGTSDDNIESIIVKGKVGKICDRSFGHPRYINGSVVAPVGWCSLKRFSAQQCDTIGNQAFYLNRQLESVDIPGGIKHVGIEAFYECESLSNFPFNAEMSFEKGSFQSTALSEAVIGDWCESIPARAFCKCESLKAITVAPTVTEVEDYAFSGCLMLNNIDFKNIKSIGERAFNSTALTTIDLPDGLYNLGECAFYGVRAREVSLPTSLKNIPKHAFMESQGAIFTWRSSNNMVNEDYNSENAIGNHAFGLYIGNLEEFVVPEGINVIDGYAFRQGKFKTIRLPSTLTSLNATAFNQCKNMQSIYCNAVEPPYVTDAYDFIPNEILTTFTGTVYVPAESVAKYRYSSFWGHFNIEPISVAIESIKLNHNEVTMRPGDELQLIAEIMPSNATNQYLNWYSTDESVVSVDGSGNIAALSSGEAEVIAVTTDGSGLLAYCFVKVDEINGIDIAESGVLNVTVDGHDLIVESDNDIVVINMSGFAVYSGPATRIRTLQSGVYFVRSGCQVCKVVVK